jgi:hypothetical protein
MAFLVGGANSAADTGPYDIDNSLKFFGVYGVKTTYLSFQNGESANGNRRTWTASFWIKRSETASSLPTYGNNADGIFTTWDGGGFSMCFDDEDRLKIIQATTILRLTNRFFRDMSAWYHLVLAVDTTDGTADDRMKIYVNGVQETSFHTNATITQNTDFPTNHDSAYYWYGVDWGSSYHRGYMAEIAVVDGTQYAASDFGEFDSASGIWKPKDFKDNITFGNNGHYLEFKQSGTNQDSSGLGADTGGNDKHFAVINLVATDQCTDTPTNNFATFNPLIKSTNTYSEGNTLVSMDSSADSKTTSTIGVSKGKWYMEFLRNDNDNWPVGIAGSTIEGAYVGGASTDSLSFWAGLAGGGAAETQLYVNGSEIDDPWNATAWADGDVVALLLNADDEEISLYKNNSIVGSAYDYSGLNWSQVFFALGNYISGNTYKTNFGNPSFTISSGNADANGYGNFEHAPPNGYYALCTKNLAEFG